MRRRKQICAPRRAYLDKPSHRAAAAHQPHIAHLSFGEYNSDDFQVFLMTLKQSWMAKLNANGSPEIKGASEIGKQFQMLLVDESI